MRRAARGHRLLFREWITPPACRWSVGSCDVGRGGELSNASPLLSVMDGVTRHMAMIAAKRLKLGIITPADLCYGAGRSDCGRLVQSGRKVERPSRHAIPDLWAWRRPPWRCVAQVAPVP